MPSLDYDGFLQAVFAVTRDVREVEKAFRRMVFNVLAMNRDDHVRQHAFLMDGEGRWSLSPAVDSTFSNGPGGEHYMAVAGEGRAITAAHVRTVGEHHGLKPAKIAEMVDEVSATVAGWDRWAAEADVAQSGHTISKALADRRREFLNG